MTQLGKYQLVRKLAAGGMAEVFLAKAAGPMGFEKTLVLKRIHPHLAGDQPFVEMFLSEAKLVAQLDHPNIVQIFDFGEAEGSYYLAMEYIDGPNLRVLTKRARTVGTELDPVLCARIISSACEGLAFAHEFRDPATDQPLGLVHRDISADNILLSRQGAVKVVDFGVAKVAGMGPHTQTGVIKGKIAYMAPEQLRNKALDRRADVYALGVVLYELLTGYRPYRAPSDVTLMEAILYGEPMPAVNLRPDLSQPLMQILDRALAKEREDRYPDCRAFQLDLERFILASGKPMGAYQIAQVVSELVEVDTLPLGTPRFAETPSGQPAPKARVGSGSSPALGVAAQVTLSPAQQPPAAPVAPTLPPKEETSSTTVPVLETGETEPVTEMQAQTIATVIHKGQGRRGLVLTSILGAMLVAAAAYLFMTGEEVPTTPPPPEPIQATSPEEASPRTPDSPGSTGTELPTPAPGGEAHTEGSTTPPAEPEVIAEQNVPSSDGTPPLAITEKTPAIEENPVTPKAGPTPAGQTVPPPGVPVGKKPGPATTSNRKRPVATGTVEFRIRPYAMVSVDGKKLGETPFSPVEITEGWHIVRAVNTTLGKDVTRNFEVRPGQLNVFKLNLYED